MLDSRFGRGVLPLWLEKFVRHGNGIALVPERTSTVWWQGLVSQSDMILCVNSKIPFANATGEQTSAFPSAASLCDDQRPVAAENRADQSDQARNQQDPMQPLDNRESRFRPGHSFGGESHSRSGVRWTRRWSKPDSNSRSHSVDPTH